MVVTETVTLLVGAAVPLTGVAESQVALCFLLTVQFKVPPPALVIRKVCERGKKGSDWMALKLNDEGEREIIEIGRAHV